MGRRRDESFTETIQLNDSEPDSDRRAPSADREAVLASVTRAPGTAGLRQTGRQNQTTVTRTRRPSPELDDRRQN